MYAIEQIAKATSSRIQVLTITMTGASDGKKGFNRSAVDLVKRAIGAVIEPVLSEAQKNAIQPGSEGGLRRGKVKAKKLPARRKRDVLL